MDIQLTRMRSELHLVASLTHQTLFITQVATLILVLSGATWMGLEIVGTTSVIVIITTLLPFAVLIVLGFSTVNWDLVTATIPLSEVNWSLYMTALFWSNNYWDAVSTLVRDHRTPFI